MTSVINPKTGKKIKVNGPTFLKLSKTEQKRALETRKLKLNNGSNKKKKTVKVIKVMNKKPRLFTKESFKNSPASAWKYSVMTSDAWKETENIIWSVMRRSIRFSHLNVRPNDFTKLINNFARSETSYRLISDSKAAKINGYLDKTYGNIGFSNKQISNLIQALLERVILEPFGSSPPEDLEDNAPITLKHLENMVKNMEFYDWAILVGNYSFASKEIKREIGDDEASLDALIIAKSYKKLLK